MKESARTGRPIGESAALAILRCRPEELPEIMACASAVRVRRFGNTVHLCSIMNARSGACSEDCAFCAQSARHRTGADVYGLRSAAEMVRAAEYGARYGIDHFGIVTSGCSLNSKGLEVVCRALRKRGRYRAAWCASLGDVDASGLRRLKEAGLVRFHHNIETAESFFGNICTTHTFRERIETIRRVRSAGLEVCSGGILGMGESAEQRVEMAMTLRDERVESIPLNFLVPVKGTRLEKQTPMKPLDILRCVAMFRLANPRAEIKVCAGRLHLRDLQSMIFHAGASGMMVGPLLTVAGREPELDFQMIRDLEMDLSGDEIPKKRSRVGVSL